jgi:hypothetical protein
MRQTSSTDLGDVFVTSLVDGDTPRLVTTLDPDVQMRALIPPGPIEVLGAEAVAGKFAAWFGNAEQLELIRSVSEPVADRLHVSYRLRVKRAGDPWNVVEQHLPCVHDGGRITPSTSSAAVSAPNTPPADPRRPAKGWARAGAQRRTTKPA